MNPATRLITYFMPLGFGQLCVVQIVFAKIFFQMRLPLGIELAPGRSLQFRRGIESLLKMLFTAH